MEIKLNSSKEKNSIYLNNPSPIKNISSSLSSASTLAMENILNKSETEKKSRPKISTSSIPNDLLISKIEFSPKKKTLLDNNNSIKTFCRIRPFKGKNELFFKSTSDPKKLIINKENLQKLKINSNFKLINSYTFTDIFDENSTQEQIFSATCEPLIKNLLENNQSGLIFTYGMTNAGKTFTIIGTPNQPGILPLSLTFIFNYFEEKKLFEKYELYANFIEIYNEDVFDLLANDPNGKNKFFKQKLNIKENINNIFYCQDVKYVQILNMETFNDILNLGISKKVHNATNLNINSSRSHSIFKIILRNKNIDYSNNNNINEISLSIVDLAGSERAKRSETSGINLIEACKINQSLSILGKCLEAMKYNTLYVNKKLVPFRESKLTKLFCEYFQGEQNITMITNINPRKEDFEETIRALNYSCIAKEIKPVKSVLFNQTKINKRNSWNNNLNKNANNNSFEYSKTDIKSNKNNNNENSINEEEEFIQDDNYSSIDLNLTDLDNNLIIPDNIKNNSEIAKLIEEIQNLRNEVLGLKNNNNNISSVPLLESEEQKENKNSNNNNNNNNSENNNNNNNNENNNNNPYFNNNNNNNNNNFQFPFNFNPNMFNPYFFNPYGFYQNFPLMLPSSNLNSNNNNNNINNDNLSLLNCLSNLPYSNNNNINNSLGQEIAKNLSNLPKEQKTNGVNFFFINSKFSDFRYDKNGIIPEEDENYNEENEEKINKRKNDKNNRKKNNKKKNNNKQKRKRKKKDDNFLYKTPKKIEENIIINNSNETVESKVKNDKKEDYKSNILNKENFNLSFDLTSEVKNFEKKNNFQNSLLYTEPKIKYKNLLKNFKF